MAGFGIASNTAWSFFMDRDNGIFYEMLTYPISRAEYLLGKVLFNVFVGVVQALITIVLARAVLGVALRPGGFPLLAAVGHRRHRGLVLLLRDLRAGASAATTRSTR